MLLQWSSKIGIIKSHSIRYLHPCFNGWIRRSKKTSVQSATNYLQGPDKQADALGEAAGAFLIEELQTGVQKFRIALVGHFGVELAVFADTSTGNHDADRANFVSLTTNCGLSRIAHCDIVVIHSKWEAMQQIGDARVQTKIAMP
jgi:hypothetical protein